MAGETAGTEDRISSVGTTDAACWRPAGSTFSEQANSRHPGGRANSPCRARSIHGLAPSDAEERPPEVPWIAFRAPARRATVTRTGREGGGPMRRAQVLAVACIVACTWVSGASAARRHHSAPHYSAPVHRHVAPPIVRAPAHRIAPVIHRPRPIVHTPRLVLPPVARPYGVPVPVPVPVPMPAPPVTVFVDAPAPVQQQPEETSAPALVAPPPEYGRVITIAPPAAGAPRRQTPGCVGPACL